MQAENGTVAIRGDNSGRRDSFVARTPEGVSVSDSLERLLPQVTDRTGAPLIAPFGVSQLLGAGLVPLPHTVFQEVYSLGVGDVANLSASGGEVTVAHHCDYPWVERTSRKDQEPSTRRLFELICRSVEDALVSADGPAVLLMSSGKDSVALALALAEIGSDTTCLTYKSSDTDREHELAAEFCATLGLEHDVVEMPPDPGVVAASLGRFFDRAPLPCGDHATIPHVMVAAAAGLETGGLMDGGGNDPYMGFLLSADNRKKLRLRVRGRRLAELVSRLTPVDSPVNYLARSQSGALLPGRSLRHHEVRGFYADAVPIAGYWYSETAGVEDAGEAMLTSRIRHTEGARSNLKSRLVARAFGLDPLQPFCNATIADYCFHLPLTSRYDTRRGTNKLLLRQLLREKIGYDEARVG
nr:asparagine synthase-related protein [Acidimicrobiia bacterium]